MYIKYSKKILHRGTEAQRDDENKTYRFAVVKHFITSGDVRNLHRMYFGAML
jgi:hypothetical protein